MNCSNFGLSSRLRWMPPCATAVAITATTDDGEQRRERRGDRAERRPHERRRARVRSSGRDRLRLDAATAARARPAAARSTTGSVTAAAPTPTHAERSWDCESWPFLRTSFIRFVGGLLGLVAAVVVAHVSSPPAAASTARSVSAGDDAGSASEDDAGEQSVSRILSGKPKRERVERRRDAGEQAEADIGEEEHDDERPGDLQRASMNICVTPSSAGRAGRSRSNVPPSGRASKVRTSPPSTSW